MLLARLRGTVTLSYSCHNLADDREMFPSSVVLSAFRILSGEREGDHAALNRWLAPAESFAPEKAEKALTESEWWLWRTTGSEDVVDPQTLLSDRYPHLGRGFQLAAERRSDRFTVFDGWIPSPGPGLDLTTAAGPPVSASRLETLGDCPLRYFFRYVLEIQPPDELMTDPDKWLDPLARGSLLHEVFERFFKDLIKRNALPDAARDESLLKRTLQTASIAIEKRSRPQAKPSSGGKSRSFAGPHASSSAKKTSTAGKPAIDRLFMEVSIGMKPEGPPTVLDTDEPVRANLPSGRSLRIRGRIDRIDKVAGNKANAFAIWDYKTGGTWKYTQEPRPFWAGRVVQHALYTMVMNNRLQALPDEFPGARIEQFGYFFPSETGRRRKDRIHAQAARARRRGALEKLATIASSGAFLATNQHDKDCNFCDYIGICGDVVRVAAASDRKLKSQANLILTPYAELRADAKTREEA